MRMRFYKLLIAIIVFIVNPIYSQLNSIGYMSPKEYTIAGIVVDGVRNLDHNLIIQKSELKRGSRINIPGEEIANAIRKLWAQNLFSDVQISADKIAGSDIFLVIKLSERERLSRYSFKGVSKSEGDNLREDLNLFSGKIVTDDLLLRVKQSTKNYFVDKGFLRSKVEVVTTKDTLVNNSVLMKINIEKGNKFKINAITITGNTALTAAKIKRQMKDTKEKKWYKLSLGSKFQYATFKTDKSKILAKYNELSYRDAEIKFDTVYNFDDKSVNIDLTIDEGRKYFIRSIQWNGNLKYSSGQLDTVLGIKAGDEYNQATLDARLYMNPNGNDVSSLYMDDGYLFFQITPIEKSVKNDSVDLEFRIYEGKQARIKNITVKGNSKTSDHVILRDMYTHPGDLFSRDAIIRTQRQLAQNGYFDPEKLGVNPAPNPNDGTVDIEYVVEERPSDQIELSGGWGKREYCWNFRCFV